MSLQPAFHEELTSTVLEEYQRYERYLALAATLALVPIVSMLFPHPMWPGCLLVLGGLLMSFRKYHRVLHRHVGAPTVRSDMSLQLWGTLAQAITWGTIPVSLALMVIQFGS